MFKSDHTAIAVQDLARSRAFYVHLGGRVVSKPSPNFVEMMLGDLRLHLVRALTASSPEDGRVGIDHVCLRVPTVGDLERVRDLINSSPDRGERPPYEIEDSEKLGDGFVDHAEEHPPLKTLYAKDPDGITIEIRAYNG